VARGEPEDGAFALVALLSGTAGVVVACFGAVEFVRVSEVMPFGILSLPGREIAGLLG
jgi:hypothetical protein